MADAQGGRPGGGRGPPSAPRRRSLIGAIAYWSVVGVVWIAIGVVGFFAVFAFNLPDTSKIFDVKRQPSITYLDRAGAEIAVRGSQFSPPVDIDQLPPYVPAAFVSIEDQRFYSHWGFDVIGIARSLLADLKSGHTQQGASTITQQLARNLFLTPDQTIRRKAQELVLAVWLERKFTKKQILGLYLNRVYFGEGAYGIEAASQRYFNKPASQLTVGEAALLAGLMKGPSHYSPVSETDRAERRATIVLDKMVETGAITPAQRDEAFKQPVRVSTTMPNQNAQYFVDYVDSQVRALVGQPQQDLVVQTTLDLTAQAAGERAVRSVVADSTGRGVQQAALVAVDGQGRIRAYVGGVDYSQSQYDRASLAQRQAGSSFKPFVYLTAMEAGHTPQEMTVDEPITIGNWTPHNFEPGFLGPMTLETAFKLSINTVAARLGNQVGTVNVAATAHRLGITTPIQTAPSMALGAVEVTPLEMAGAYSAFSNGGFLTKPYGVQRIQTAGGQVLYDHDLAPPPRAQVIGQPALSEMVELMRAVVASGTGVKASLPGFDIAGKTGTTTDYRDAWFVGYTGGFTAAVWTGRDDDTPMRGVTGGSAPAAIWHAFMAAVLPHMGVEAIPGGAQPLPSLPDLIGDILSGAPPNASSSPPAIGAPAAGAPPAATPAEPPPG